MKKLKKLSKAYKSLSDPEFVKSGSVVIDALLGGGIPKGMFILWSAENGCGKSTGALHISKVYCMQGLKVLYLDYEGGVNKNQLDGMGLTPFLFHVDNNPEGTFYLYQIKTYKDGEKILDDLLEDVDLVIVDSITNIITEKQSTSSAEDALPGIDARTQSVFLKKYKADSVRQGTSWIIIAQMRTKIAMGYGQVTRDEGSGGNALKHAVDVRLQSKKKYKGDLIRKETANGEQEVPYGAICVTYAEKNRYARPKIPLDLTIIFGKGISNEYAYEGWLENNGNVKKNGSWYEIKMNDHNEKFQGQGSVVKWVGEHRDEVKDYINLHGGYRLLVDNADTLVDIGGSSSSDESEEYYDEAMALDEFEAVGGEEEE